MLTIICGEDVVSSRSYYASLRSQFKDKGYEIRDIGYQDMDKLIKWLGESVSLFSQKKVFFGENFDRHIKKDSKKILDDLAKVSGMKDIELVDWESVSLRELKLAKLGTVKTASKRYIVKEFKPNQTIFKLLDSLCPGAKVVFIRYLDQLKNLDEQFIFIMLLRQVRNLILVKEGVTPSRMQSWQLYKFKSLAARWKIENLVNFYEALLKIDIASKSSATPYSIRDSLAILACHFL